MRTIREMGQPELTWEQPRKHRREYELRAGEEVVATLRWENHHSQTASAEAAEGRWTFQRRGILHQHVEARLGESELEIARFQPHWRGGGILEFPDGRRLGLRPTSFWNTEWVWTTADNNMLLRIKRGSGRSATKGQIEPLPGASAIPELALLVLLGWYLVSLAADDATAAVIAASVATTVAAS